MCGNDNIFYSSILSIYVVAPLHGESCVYRSRRILAIYDDVVTLKLI